MPEALGVKLNPETRRVGNQHAPHINLIPRRIESRHRRVIPFDEAQPSNGAGKVAGRVVAVVPAVMVRG